MEKLTDIANIKYLLTIFGNASAKKRFGQNFLTSENVLQQIIKAAEISDADTILEIGPGLGVLTHELTLRAKKVVSVEMDYEMMSILQKTLVHEPTAKNLTLIQQDALKFNIAASQELNHEPYKLVANLPYNVATAILKKFLVDSVNTSNPTPNTQPTRIVVLVQQEVAEKASARTGDHSVLSLTIQPYGVPRMIANVPPSAFYPSPKVTSAILLIEPHATPLLTPDLAITYFRLIHTAFTQKRKTLQNSLQQIIPKETLIAAFTKANIDPMVRPQNLATEQWIALSLALQS